MSKSVAVVVGFTEGKWHRRQLEQAFERRGYATVSDPKQADVVIAHSGGCYNVTLDLRPDQLLMLINATYWPGRSLRKRSNIMTWQIIQAVRPGNRPFWHVYKTAHNIVYAAWHAGRNLGMVRHAPHYSLPEELHHDRTIVVRNVEDPWLTPDFTKLRRYNKRVRFIEMQGEHDDCWLNPDRYIDLIELEKSSTVKEH